MKQFVKQNYQILIFISIMFVLACILICRAFYGMDITDETFYLSTAKRFSNGDMFLRDDWNTGQLFGLLLMPLYRVYVFMVGNSDGIILFVRIFFVILEVFTACFLYKTLMKYTDNFFGSLTASACICVYARGNIITVSYYSLGFLTFLLAILWWMSAYGSRYRKIFLVISGVNFAVSVLCMPYMVIVYFVLIILWIFCWIKKKQECCNALFWFTCGIVLSAGFFLLYFYNVIPWRNLMEYIPFVFQDPEMEKGSLWTKAFDLFIYYMTFFLKYTWPFYMLTFFSVFWIGKAKRINIGCKPYFALLLLFEFLIQSVYVRSYFEGGIITTFWLFAIQIQLLYPEHRNKELEKYFLIPGIFFGLAWIMGSNVGQRVANMSFLLMDLWAILLVCEMGRKYCKGLKILIQVPACLMFTVLFAIRVFDIYRDGALPQLDTRVTSGVMKGLFTEENRASAYECTLEVLKKRTNANNTIVVLGCNPWVYLESEASCGAYSTWQFIEGESTLGKYYDIFPERIPDIIVIVPEELNEFEYWKYSSHGVGVNNEQQPELNNVLRRIVDDREYSCLEEKGVTIYCENKM